MNVYSMNEIDSWRYMNQQRQCRKTEYRLKINNFQSYTDQEFKNNYSELYWLVEQVLESRYQQSVHLLHNFNIDNEKL